MTGSATGRAARQQRSTRRRVGSATAAALLVVALGSCSAPEETAVPDEPPPGAEPVAPDTGWPGPDNTGVPAGTVLDPYQGPCAITRDRLVITAKEFDCEALVIRAEGVRIEKSLILGHIDVDGDYSLTLVDSEVDAGEWGNAAVGFNGLTLSRVDVHGGVTAVNCYQDCLIEDSWLHGQRDPVGDQHLGGFLSNGGGTGGVTLRHNTISCDPPDNGVGGGCSGSGQIYADFGPLHDYTFEGNLFTATEGAYCASFGHNPGKPFGGNPTAIVVVDNQFESNSTDQCGNVAPVTSFLPGAGDVGAGNEWSNNTWADGPSAGQPIDP